LCPTASGGQNAVELFLIPRIMMILAQPPEIEDYLQDVINEKNEVFGKAHKYAIFKTNWSGGCSLI
jgi:hypothetical protein